MMLRKNPGPYHDFFLLKDLQRPTYSELRQYLPRKSRAHLSDEILRSIMFDAISWVPSFIPKENSWENYQGLDLYRMTVIDRDGAEKLSKIISLWGKLFEEGPECLTLTCAWTNAVTLDQPYGHYEKLLFDREKVVSSLKVLYGYSQAVTEGRAGYVLHVGI